MINKKRTTQKIKIKCPECEKMKDPIDFVEAEVFDMCKDCDEKMQDIFIQGTIEKGKKALEKLSNA